MADDLAAWLDPLGAGCHTASKIWAFWRLLTPNQFFLVTGMGLAATAAAVCACLCTHAYVCVCEETAVWDKERRRAIMCVFVLSHHPLINVAKPRIVCLILPPFCFLVSMALVCISHGSRSGLTSQNGYHSNAGRGLPVAMLTPDALRCGSEKVLWCGVGGAVMSATTSAFHDPTSKLCI